MSVTKHVAANNDHGSMQSYLIGFILSLIFTFIPYYLVVNQVITGTLLLVTIVGFAVIQMLIQITFFLHIGRGPKPNWNLFFFAATVGIIIFVVSASIMIMSRLHYNMSPTEKINKIVNDEGIYQIGGKETGACEELFSNHQIVIKEAQVSPVYTFANKCDTLTFINEDTASKIITFGIYPNQGVYAGEIEIEVKNGRTETITLSETGTFQFYDRLQPETNGGFIINP